MNILYVVQHILVLSSSIFNNQLDEGVDLMKGITSNMAGTVFKVLVQVGSNVADGDDVVILESMKMEVPVSADQAGTVLRVAVAEGDFVNEGDLLMELE